MSKRLTLSLIAIIAAVCGALAQQFTGNGYYRIQNNYTQRYAYLVDNWVLVDTKASKVTLTAIELWKGIERAQSDPSTVLYISQVGSQYNIAAQGTSIYAMSNVYLNLRWDDSRKAYLAYGTYSGLTKYLTDDMPALSPEQSWMCDTRSGENSYWRLLPISNSTDNFFGIKPTVEAGGKRYATIYCGFPFEAAQGMKLYYVYQLDTQRGLALYKELDNNIAPESTPIFIECPSALPSGNKVNIGAAGGKKPADSKMAGVYFNVSNYYHPHTNQTAYNKQTMRVLGKCADGSLGFVTSSIATIPANSAYLTVPAGSPADFKLVTADEYQYILDHEVVEAASVSLSKTDLQLKVGEQAAITATVQPANTTDKTVTWTSSKPEVATVDQQGNITAKSVGQATITARCGNASAQCAVKVNPVEAESLTLSATTLSMLMGEQAVLTATVLPANTTDKTVAWSSSAPTIASIDQQGRITANGIGKAVITARCGQAQAQCEVTVNPVQAASITLSATKLSLPIGDNATLTATVQPANATDKTVAWISSKPEVATVDAQGRISAKSIGETVITATCGTATATCAVTVTPVYAQSISLSAASLQLQPGQESALRATVLPENATDKTITWTSSAPDIASVNEQGVVTAHAIGQATITAACGQAKAQCAVTVNPIKAESVSLSTARLSLLLGDEAQITASVYPENTTDKTVTWTSSAPAIASVDQQGRVTAKGVGQATITASCGQASATCAVTVSPIAVSKITLSSAKLDMQPGQAATLTAAIEPENATDKTVEWSTSAATVATVDQQGRVTAMGVGYAVITARCGQASATCVVNVSPIAAASITLSSTQIELLPGASATVTATVMPENATDKTVAWASSAPEVASVDQQGRITANGVGRAVITATCGSAHATCTVTVSPIAATEVTLSQASLRINAGATASLTATVKPDNASDKTVAWSSSKPEVAAVDQQGRITAIAPGTATITARCGNAEAKCEVEVLAVAAQRVTLSASSISLKVGEESQLTATVSPENTTDKTIEWSSSSVSVATVDQQGRIKAVGVGRAVITAKCGLATATCIVEAKPIEAESLTLSQTELAITLGQRATISATVLPENATNKTVTWTSSKSSVAKVDATGQIEAVAVGQAVITARCGQLTATCTVTVGHIEATKITITPASLSLIIGQSGTLNAAVEPANASRPLTWSIDNSNVATISATGEVKALAPGQAIATAQCGDTKATCTITVQLPPVEGVSLDRRSAELSIGEQISLHASRYPENAEPAAFAWRSDNENVATVSDNGVVKAVGAGTATVTVTCGGASDACAITVRKLSQQISIETEDGQSIYVDASLPLKATATSGLPVTFEITEGAEYARIADGMLIAAGGFQGPTATIRLTASQGGNDTYLPAAAASLSVTIAKLDQAIELPASSISLYAGESAAIGASATSGLPVSITATAGAEYVKIADGTVTAIGGFDGQNASATLAITQEGNYKYNPAAPVRVEVAMQKRSQQISVEDGSRQIALEVGQSATVKASSNSQMPLVLEVVEGADVVKAEGLTITALGGFEGNTATAKLRLSQAGNGEYAPAQDAFITVTVSKRQQTLSVAEHEITLYVGSSASIDAASSSGLPVTLEMAYGYPVVSIDGLSVTALGGFEGTSSFAVLRVQQPGDGTYSPAESAEVKVNVLKLQQQIPAIEGDVNLSVGQQLLLPATASSGLPLTYEVPVGSDIVSIDGNTLTALGGFEGASASAVVRISQPGDGTYAPAADAEMHITVSKLSQEISIAQSSISLYVGEQCAIEASASSGLPVQAELVYGSDVLSIDGLSIKALGGFNGASASAVLRISQGGDGTYLPAESVTVEVTVLKRQQSISIDQTEATLYVGDAYTIEAESTSGLPLTATIAYGDDAVSIDGLEITAIGAFEGPSATASLRIEQPGNDEYLPAQSVTVNVTVLKHEQQISVAETEVTLYVGDTYQIAAASTSSLPLTATIAYGDEAVSVDGLSVTALGGFEGASATAQLRIEQPGNDAFLPAQSVTVNVTVLKREQQIVWEQDDEITLYSGEAIELTAYATSGLEVTYTLFGAEDVATISGNVLEALEVSPNGAPSVTIRAEQSGDGEYLPAAPVEKTLSVLSGIDPAEASQISITVGFGCITVNGAPERAVMEVYDMSGRLLYSGYDRSYTAAYRTTVIVRIAGLTFKAAL